jgi:hypothetical protein
MEMTDTIGYLAGALVLVTFWMRSMRALRWVAIASNVAFIAYGYSARLAPVLLLHSLLLPVNSLRLLQSYDASSGKSGKAQAQRPDEKPAQPPELLTPSPGAPR